MIFNLTKCQDPDLEIDLPIQLQKQKSVSASPSLKICSEGQICTLRNMVPGPPKIQIWPLPSRPARPAGLDQAPKCNFLGFCYLFHSACGGAQPIVFVIGLPYAIIKHFWRDFVTIPSKFSPRPSSKLRHPFNCSVVLLDTDPVCLGCIFAASRCQFELVG